MMSINLQCQSRIQAQKELAALAISNFPIPGDADFPLNGMFVKPSHGEVGKNSIVYLPFGVSIFVLFCIKTK